MTKQEIIDKYGYDKLLEYRERSREYNRNNKEKIKHQMSEWRKKNKDYENSTPTRRAKMLVRGYIKADKKYKHHNGDCDLTYEIVENIITNEPCYWCGETDWKKLGLDRIDNYRPHTFNNIICSCKRCNTLRGKKDFEYFQKRINWLKKRKLI